MYTAHCTIQREAVVLLHVVAVGVEGWGGGEGEERGGWGRRGEEGGGEGGGGGRRGEVY